jgi:hypothetical protein
MGASIVGFEDADGRVASIDQFDRRSVGIAHEVFAMGHPIGASRVLDIGERRNYLAADRAVATVARVLIDQGEIMGRDPKGQCVTTGHGNGLALLLIDGYHPGDGIGIAMEIFHLPLPVRPLGFCGAKGCQYLLLAPLCTSFHGGFVKPESTLVDAHLYLIREVVQLAGAFDSRSAIFEALGYEVQICQGLPRSAPLQSQEKIQRFGQKKLA